MNPTAKTILIWVLILVVAVALYSFVEKGSGSSVVSLSLTDFLAKIERGEVSDVAISGSLLSGHLKNAEAFRSTMPLNYTTVYDKLTAASVRVTVIPPDDTSSFGLPALVVVTGAVLWLAISAAILILVVDLSRFVKRELARTGGNHSAT